ncbi:hypothetical protein EKO04_006406 [Ascochyta lentis]|uniref:P-loop containing nucleoside triphosphate hydrolase protein n=1 Tax=Ascochyta lentis TaxID=205686 RepID=A0A8H7MI81_9PLEO|nr:hypothetical protein EKO04_006406 [Ascochyta lentis]
MSGKPIFCATHPRACSTAFERVFMTRRDLQCVHEPFGDAYYFGPERIGYRYEGPDMEKERQESGYANSTYRTIFDRIAKDNAEGKRAFIKDMAQYWIPPQGKPRPTTICPSMSNYRRGVGTNTTELSPVQTREDRPGEPYPYDTQEEPGNPTVLPKALLETYHFIFLIRHPKYSIPSYYRCTLPPLSKLTGWDYLRKDEAGYVELRELFDYLRKEGIVGPKSAGQTGETNGTNGNGQGVEICVVDADDLLDNPSGMIEAVCKTTGIEYKPEMLVWDTEEDQALAKREFEKWRGFHEDAIDSTELRARTHKKAQKTREEEDAEWKEKYGEDGAKFIRETVDENVEHYEYLKQFAIKV